MGLSESGGPSMGQEVKEPLEDGTDDLLALQEQIEEENEGLDIRSWLKIVLFIIVAGVLLFVILGFFGFLAQLEYGGY